MESFPNKGCLIPKPFNDPGCFDSTSQKLDGQHFMLNIELGYPSAVSFKGVFRGEPLFYLIRW